MNIDVKERAERAEAFFKSGFNCCQSVVMAFDDIAGMSADSLAAIASGFGGGFGRQREVCGCVSGMTLLTGFISPAADPSDKDGRTANYALVQKLCGAFREECGSIVCRELLGLAPNLHEDPTPSDRTREYYQKRPCAKMVYLAAEIIANELNDRKL